MFWFIIFHVLLEIQLCFGTFSVFYSNYNLVYNSRLKIHKRLRKIIYNFRCQILINFSAYFMSSGSFVRLLSICTCLLYISQVLFKVLLGVMDTVQLAITNMLCSNIQDFKIHVQRCHNPYKFLHEHKIEIGRVSRCCRILSCDSYIWLLLFNKWAIIERCFKIRFGTQHTFTFLCMHFCAHSSLGFTS